MSVQTLVHMTVTHWEDGGLHCSPPPPIRFMHLFSSMKSRHAGFPAGRLLLFGYFVFPVLNVERLEGRGS